MMTSILIIDDEPSLRIVTRMMLTRLGYQIIEAAEGPQGEALAAESNPDVVLLDVMMPLQNGYTTCENLRAQGYGGKIVFMTAVVDANKAGTAALYGADGYLEKPVTIAILREYLGELLTSQAA
jgi:CheY-like chemotaxis protein